MTPKDVVRFWKKVDKNGPISPHVPRLGKCWVWMAATTRAGDYGDFWAENTMLRAHRVSWMLEHGPIPKGMDVLHKCDNRSCLNPAHLFLGDDEDNAKDRSAKGRNADFKGEKDCNAKLKESDVINIRAAAAFLRMVAKECSTAALAKKYGVGKCNIRHIVTGLSWKHIPLTPNKLALVELERRMEKAKSQ